MADQFGRPQEPAAFAPERGSDTGAPSKVAAEVVGQASPVGLRRRLLQIRAWSLGGNGLRLIEVAVVLLWVLFFTRPYLDMNPSVVPMGREYLAAIQTHAVWETVRSCGLCGMWFGNVAGGFPAFADPVASTLHPLVIFSTFVWGVINGSKAALVGAFLLAGLAQWWLGSLLGLRWPARLWGAAMAVSAGYLASRMNLGAFSLTLSTAAMVPVFPAVIALARTRGWGSVVVLAGILALLAVGGTGYMQVGMVTVLPASVLLVPWTREALTRLLGRLARAVGLAVLFAAPLLVPFVHFLPQFAKDADPTFETAQPLAYVPLNLVIRDVDFFLTETLEKKPWPSHYANFVGWIPVLLALYGVFGYRNDPRRREILFLAAAVLLALWAASGTPFAWMVKAVGAGWFAQLIGGLRYTSFIASLAVPPLIGLSMIGLDRLIAGWPRLRVGLERTGATASGLSFDTRWLLVIPLLIALNQARLFSSVWMGTGSIDPYVRRVVGALKTDGLQWVNVPLGEHFFVAPAIEQGLKLSADAFRTWHWHERPIPMPKLEANRGGPPPGMTQFATVEGINIHVAQAVEEYASVVGAEAERTACHAEGMGGDIDVTCDLSEEGTLVVEENNWSGWMVQVDGAPADLVDAPWLSVRALEGLHTYSFRYRPWDVPLGFALLCVGILLSVWMWLGERSRARVPQPGRSHSPPSP